MRFGGAFGWLLDRLSLSPQDTLIKLIFWLLVLSSSLVQAKLDLATCKKLLDKNLLALDNAEKFKTSLVPFVAPTDVDKYEHKLEEIMRDVRDLADTLNATVLNLDPAPSYDRLDFEYTKLDKAIAELDKFEIVLKSRVVIQHFKQLCDEWMWFQTDIADKMANRDDDDETLKEQLDIVNKKYKLFDDDVVLKSFTVRLEQSFENVRVDDLQNLKQHNQHFEEQHLLKFEKNVYSFENSLNFLKTKLELKIECKPFKPYDFEQQKPWYSRRHQVCNVTMPPAWLLLGSAVYVMAMNPLKPPILGWSYYLYSKIWPPNSTNMSTSLHPMLTTQPNQISNDFALVKLIICVVLVVMALSSVAIYFIFFFNRHKQIHPKNSNPKADDAGKLTNATAPSTSTSSNATSLRSDRRANSKTRSKRSTTSPGGSNKSSTRAKRSPAYKRN